ncbi:DUF1080 domain-containing protein [Curtobacterium sp. MCBD17_035]|uniref:3-keto-disaccharide hydrolase n=1 Tax=Curtobacterium sp. MCBD17_035 TaxID=2175673 RepID=UPI000DA7A3D1|nr:DUF1080 domain-containing protein [Curtobacterium sp. MCBD17_035]WIB68319.1 DUF1080 domain-containing protein [Curtobacterium sp. MCBD17_035]
MRDVAGPPGRSAPSFVATALFDGVTLDGWHAVPRTPVAARPGGPAPDPASPAVRDALATGGAWSVVDGAVVGGQERRGLGGYLVSDEVFGDVDLTVLVRPDWPADTGIMLRASALGSQGYQVLVDHRPSGSIGGFYGNGIGGFHAVGFAVDAVRDAGGRAVGLTEDDPVTSREPVTPEKRALLTHAASAEAFLAAWRWDDWNELRIRCVGEWPVLTTWVNGLLVAECDTGALPPDRFDRAAVRALLGRAGHIALEVHDNDPALGDERWGPGAVVRWRDLRVVRLD